MNMVVLMSVLSWKSDILRVMICLVVAARLQSQHPSFRLRTLSNTPSVQKKVTVGTSLLTSNDGMCFPYCKLCLKRRLGEPGQFMIGLQFGRAHQLVKSNPQLCSNMRDYELMRRVADIATSFFHAKNDHVQGKGPTSQKTDQGDFTT
jgi:hypothetical protein